ALCFSAARHATGRPYTKKGRIKPAQLQQRNSDGNLHNARAGLATAHTSMENRWTLPIGRFTDAGRRALGADASGANLLRDTSVDFDQIDFLRVTMNGYEPTREAAMAAFAK